ncbi:hypothetical protein LguiB_020924 [Lonicera macranthoides]
MITTLESVTSYDELPRRKFMAIDLYQWQGFWYPLYLLKAVLLAQSNFKARNDDILLASSMKTGTTWLKALMPTIMNYNNTHGDDDDPLIMNHPNELIPSLELQIFSEQNASDKYNISGACSPRLFRTHMPYAMLPNSFKESTDCKIVYITRDPKDAFVSLWHFLNAKRKQEDGPYPIDKAFEEYCEGVHQFGPFHDHVAEYWEESLKRPRNILFLNYEEMKRDPKGQVKKLASFLGRPFEKDEDVEKTVWRCSLERLKNLEVNKSGLEPWVGIPKSSYFRLGVVGDWKNSLSLEMKQRLDEITNMKLKGFGLELDASKV